MQRQEESTPIHKGAGAQNAPPRAPAISAPPPAPPPLLLPPKKPHHVVAADARRDGINAQPRRDQFREPRLVVALAVAGEAHANRVLRPRVAAHDALLHARRDAAVELGGELARRHRAQVGRRRLCSGCVLSFGCFGSVGVGGPRWLREVVCFSAAHAAVVPPEPSQTRRKRQAEEGNRGRARSDTSSPIASATPGGSAASSASTSPKSSPGGSSPSDRPPSKSSAEARAAASARFFASSSARRRRYSWLCRGR